LSSGLPERKGRRLYDAYLNSGKDGSDFQVQQWVEGGEKWLQHDEKRGENGGTRQASGKK